MKTYTLAPVLRVRAATLDDARAIARGVAQVGSEGSGQRVRVLAIADGELIADALHGLACLHAARATTTMKNKEMLASATRVKEALDLRDQINSKGGKAMRGRKIKAR
jgi:hypothetical protein